MESAHGALIATNGRHTVAGRVNGVNPCGRNNGIIWIYLQGFNTLTTPPTCPKCNSGYTYESEGLFICPECGNEWATVEEIASTEELIAHDANGTVLKDGDTVVLIKDLKVKGSSSPLKIGTKVKNIRIVDGDHNIDCKIDGFGAMSLKSEFVKKS